MNDNILELARHHIRHGEARVADRDATIFHVDGRGLAAAVIINVKGNDDAIPSAFFAGFRTRSDIGTEVERTPVRRSPRGPGDLQFERCRKTFDGSPGIKVVEDDGAIQAALVVSQDEVTVGDRRVRRHQIGEQATVQGEAGFVFGPREFYVAIFEWAKKKGIYIWVDEVQTFGRTHQLFAFQTFELDSYVDVVTVAKVLQEGGVLYTEELNPKPGLIAGTFCGSIPQIIAGTKTVKFLTEGSFYGKQGRMAEIENTFLKKLNALMEGSCKGKIGYAGGIGTMISFEVGKADKDDTNKFLNKLFENGVIAFSAGRGPVRVRFLIPLAITNEHIDELFKIVEKTVVENF